VIASAFWKMPATRLAALTREPDVELDLDTLFAFGLARLLDGLAVLIGDGDCALGGSGTGKAPDSLGGPRSR
jgi:hypothetical protein